MIDKSDLVTITEEPFNAETQFSALNRELTPLNMFYVRNHFDVPALAADQLSLTVNGAVATPSMFSVEELKQYPVRELLLVMECAGNGRSSMEPAINGTPWNLGAVSQAVFAGTSLSNLLEKVEMSKDAVEVRFTGADLGKIRTGEIENYARSLPIEVALHPDTLLAWGMNGEELTDQHGYPLRLVVPGWYGMASVKWLQEITVLTEQFNGFFQTEEYVYIGDETVADDTPVTDMQIRSLILEPRDMAERPILPIKISGVAWTGTGEITGVQISFDRGANWITAEIQSSTSKYGFSRWIYEWQPENPGKYTITARAQDSSGSIQPLKSRWNKGGYGNNISHQIDVIIR